MLQSEITLTIVSINTCEPIYTGISFTHIHIQYINRQNTCTGLYIDVTVLSFFNIKFTDMTSQDGWFHTGDLGVVHKDGRVELKDRSKGLSSFDMDT